MKVGHKQDAKRIFVFYWRALGVADYAITEEHRFAPPRRFRFDIAFIPQHVAVEVEGGVWVKGRHIRPSGYEKDCLKYNLAVVQGWRVLRYTPQMLKRDPAACIEQVLNVLRG